MQRYTDAGADVPVSGLIQPQVSDRSDGAISTRSISVFNNKETLAHFSNRKTGDSETKNSFITTAYRLKNLQLAYWLEKTHPNENSHTHKTLWRLRCCSSISIVEATTEGAKICSSTNSCKSAHCAICARARSAKISARLMAAVGDVANVGLFKNRHFYFVTITVKHDSVTRQGNYLKEFQNDVRRLYRSKLWKSMFPYSKQKPSSGWITCTETTFNTKTNSYHIHAHVLVCGPKVKRAAKAVQKDLRAKWHKLTKDSPFGVRFDLLKLSPAAMQSNADDAQRDAVAGAVRELIKYGTKAGTFESWNLGKAQLYADWVDTTKGRNFINASGLFRGLQITGEKSKYDPRADDIDDDWEKPEFEPNPDAEYWIGRTSQIQFNHSTKFIPRYGRKRILEKIELTGVQQFRDVTDVIRQIKPYEKMSMAPKDVEDYLDKRIADERRADFERGLAGLAAADLAAAAAASAAEAARQEELKNRALLLPHRSFEKIEMPTGHVDFSSNW